MHKELHFIRSGNAKRLEKKVFAHLTSGNLLYQHTGNLCDKNEILNKYEQYLTVWMNIRCTIMYLCLNFFKLSYGRKWTQKKKQTSLHISPMQFCSLSYTWKWLLLLARCHGDLVCNRWTWLKICSHPTFCRIPTWTVVQYSLQRCNKKHNVIYLFSNSSLKHMDF